MILAMFHKGQVELEELHRFPNNVLRIDGTLRWDIDALWTEIRAGLRKAAGRDVQSVGVDSWALDYVLMRDGQRFERAPFCYRDARTEVSYPDTRSRLGEERIYAETGIQFMPINSLYHLVADAAAADAPFKEADQFLMIGDWFHYLLSGRTAQEESNASTTQLWNPVRRQWSDELIGAAGLPRAIFPPVVPPCTVLGDLTAELQRETGLGPVKVVAGCVHDTGAAVAAVPAEPGEDWAYISSGTWSLVGVELPRPLIAEEARLANFTNETGVGGTSRFLRNASGMWLLQECRRAWRTEGGDFSYGEIAKLAEGAEPFRSLVNPDDAVFLRPSHMPTAIADFCRRTGQPAPETPGQFARCIVESLGLLYDSVLNLLERVAGRSLRVVHIVGGGSQNALLNQITADATGREVRTGPVEATAVGNVLLQALALGEIRDLDELRGVVRASFEIQTFRPRHNAAWARAKEAFRRISA